MRYLTALLLVAVITLTPAAAVIAPLLATGPPDARSTGAAYETYVTGKYAWLCDDHDLCPDDPDMDLTVVVQP